MAMKRHERKKDRKKERKTERKTERRKERQKEGSLKAERGKSDRAPKRKENNAA